MKATGNLRLLTSAVVRQEALAYALVAASFPRRLENVMQRGRSPLAELLYTNDWEGDSELLLERLVAANQYNVNFGALLGQWKESASATLEVLELSR